MKFVLRKVNFLVICKKNRLNRALIVIVLLRKNFNDLPLRFNKLVQILLPNLLYLVDPVEAEIMLLINLK